MLYKLKTIILRKILSRNLCRKCPEYVPRIGSEAKNVNCWSFTILQGGNPYFKIDNIEGDQLQGAFWKEGAYSAPGELSLDSILGVKEWNFCHYYGESSICYQNLRGFFIHRFTGLFYLRVHLYRLKNRFTQAIYNKRSLGEKSRQRLIEALIDLDLTCEHRGLTVTRVLVELYGERVFLHPSYSRFNRLIGQQLESLVQDGCLNRINHEYVIQGHAYSVLEDINREEKRHSDSVNVRIWALIISAVIAIATVVNIFVRCSPD